MNIETKHAELLMRRAEQAEGLKGFGVTAAFYSDLSDIVDIYVGKAKKEMFYANISLCIASGFIGWAISSI